MINIFKYNIDKLGRSVQQVYMPIGANILSIQNKHENIAIWVEVDAVNASETRSFAVLTTGATKPDNPLRYCTTLQFSGGDYVVHIYELV